MGLSMVKLSNSNLQMSLFTGDRICELFGIYSPTCTKEPQSLTPSQQMYPQSSFPKISTAKGLSVRWSLPPNWVALFELNKSMPETARTAENVQFNSCCTVAERRNSHSWKDDWLAKNRDPGWADTFSDSSRVPAPGKKHQITRTQLSRDKWAPASSLCSSTISLLDILSWSTAMIEILLFSLFGEKPSDPISKSSQRKFGVKRKRVGHSGCFNNHGDSDLCTLGLTKFNPKVQTAQAEIIRANTGQLQGTAKVR